MWNGLVMVCFDLALMIQKLCERPWTNSVVHRVIKPTSKCTHYPNKETGPCQEPALPLPLSVSWNEPPLAPTTSSPFLWSSPPKYVSLLSILQLCLGLTFLKCSYKICDFFHMQLPGVVFLHLESSMEGEKRQAWQDNVA